MKWHPYWKWEDFAAGMYAQVKTAEMLKLSAAAAEHMVLSGQWGDQMRKVIYAWPISASQNLLCATGNGRAWMGAAAMCFWRSVPSCVTRNAWWRLTEEQQDAANLMADSAISEFRSLSK
jgi:hypothetical protein